MTVPELVSPQQASGPLLVVEDDLEIGRLLEKTLASTNRPVRLATSAAAAADAIALATPSLIVLDLVLPDADGRSLLAKWRSAPVTAHIPVIVLTVSGTPEIRNQCMALGASEFVEKPFDVAEFSATVDKLLSAPSPSVGAGKDPLTGAASRAALVYAYENMSSSLGPDAPLSLAIIDIDRFRSVHESCGKDTGDAVLRGVASLIGTSAASEQVVGRWQGDQFMALLRGVAEPQATEWLERCLDALKSHSFTSAQGGTFVVTFSAGVVEAQKGASIEDTVTAALGCLYLAKQGGRARVVGTPSEVGRPKTTILLASDDDVVETIVRDALESHGLVVERYRDGQVALEAAQDKRVGLFLLGVDMPVMDGFELLALLRAEQRYAEVPIVMLTGVGDEDSLARALALGADDYLVKPISSSEIVAHVQRLLTRWVEGRLQELQGGGLYIRGVELLNEVFDAAAADEPLPVKDLSVLTLRIVEELRTHPAKLLGRVMNPTTLEGDHLSQHSFNIAILASVIGREMGVEGDDLDWLCLAGLLHEVGCVRLPKGFLQRTDEMSEEDRRLIRKRPELSHEIITKLAPDYAAAAEIALQVHERRDGGGYPKGLEGDQISLEAQILSAVDVFEALTHNRPYRERPQAASEAVKYLLESGNDQFFDSVLKTLILKIGLYPVGSYVSLATDEIALVLEHREHNPTRPLLAVVTDRAGKLLPSPRVSEPLLNPQVTITSSVAPPEIGPAAA
ncbi:MAG: response regulator [Acidobacteria bacterium]|nr:response regulator [Acidobacteriota bacterium]